MSSLHANWFVGLPVRAEGWFERLPEPPRNVRCFSPGDLHATVAFLGAVGEEAAHRGFAAARPWPSGPLPVCFGPVQPFGSKRHPSALSAVFGEGNDAVVDAIAAVRERVLAAAGARPDRRPPLPHVTLARIQRRAGPDERRHALAWARAVDLGGVASVLDRVALYTWSRDRRQSLFRIVDSFETSLILQPTGPVGAGRRRMHDPWTEARLKLWFAPMTRAVRIVWLLEELGLPYELERVDFAPTSDTFFQQSTPTGKLPTLEDGDVVMCESGAIAEYLIERHGDGRLAPAVGDAQRGAYLQWLHFAESTAFPPIGIVVWLTRYRRDGEDAGVAAVVADARERAASGLDHLEREFGTGPWILGEAFTAADVMLGFTLTAATLVGVIDPVRHAKISAYLGRLQERPAYRFAAGLE